MSFQRTRFKASLANQPAQYIIVGKYNLGAITTVVGADVFKGELRCMDRDLWHLARLCFGREEELYEHSGWSRWREFVVKTKVNEAEDIISFYFEPKDEEPLPWQYISAQTFVEELGFKQSRQYVLTSFYPHITIS